jgi:putative tricarboxylic transport membrane protein
MAYDRRPDVTTFVNQAMRDKASPLLLGAVLTGLGVLVLLAARIVMGDATEARLGPRAFPALIGTSLVALGLVFMMARWRGSGFPEAARPARRGVLPWIMAALVGGIVIVEPLGFPLAAAWVFVMSARAFGSRQWWRNALIGVVLGLLVYVILTRVFGATLPGGSLGTFWPRT